MNTILALALVLSMRVQEKLPVPTPADQKKAEAEIRAVFKEEFSKKDREAKRSLARRLLTESEDAKNTSASRYAVLFLARDLAVESLDILTTWKSIEALDRLYSVEKPLLTGASFTNNLNALKIEALNKAQKNATSPEDSLILGDAYFKVAEDAAHERNFSDGIAAAQAAEKYGKTAKATGLADRATALAKEISELGKEDDEFTKAILNKADDPAARLIKGRYSLFVVGDDKAGIENLIDCSDEALKSVAKLEAGPVMSPDSIMNVAEAWLSLSNKETSPLNKRRYKERAIHWFENALKEAGGILKTKIEKRLLELMPKVTGPTQGLVGYWSCDEGAGTVLHDQSGKSNHGTLSGTKWATGIVGNAISFNGTDSVGTLGGNGLPDIQAPKTVAFWYYMEAIPGPDVAQAQVLVAVAGEGSAAAIGFSKSKLMVWGDGIGTYGAAAPPAVGKWHHVAYLYDGTVSRLYVDGMLQDTNKDKPQSGPCKKVEIGHWLKKQVFNGLLDEIRIYNRPLSETEIQALAKLKK